MFVIDPEEFDESVQAGNDLIVERVMVLPVPVILEDMFPETKIGLIWIPNLGCQNASALVEWTAEEHELVLMAEKALGCAIKAEMDATGCPIIRRIFEDGSQAVLFRHGSLEAAKRILGAMGLH